MTSKRDLEILREIRADIKKNYDYIQDVERRMEEINLILAQNKATKEKVLNKSKYVMRNL